MDLIRYLFNFDRIGLQYLFKEKEIIKLNSVALYSITEKKVASFNFKDFSSNQNIDVSKLARGVYFLKISNSIIKVMKE